MGALDGRVAVITGAGRGIGREHALLFAAEGAAVVVNDIASGYAVSPAAEVVAEIRRAGGQAVLNHDDVAEADGAERMVRQAVREFGALHVLVNNAGILRDRTIVNMTDEEWDDVIRVHLRGHFMPTRAAARYWREQHKSGHVLQPSLINTTSTSGLFNTPGQVNYGSAKTGITSLTIIAQRELGRYGVRANAIAPAARTRLTLSTPGASDAMLHPPESGFDALDPGNISPFVAYLATADCPIAGRVFFVRGGRVQLFQPFAVIDGIDKEGRWTIPELQVEAARLAEVPFALNDPYQAGKRAAAT
jgi:NAD(P)-dependent dehydrogenase (short-subunit alcohol dehydrogenase family)